MSFNDMVPSSLRLLPARDTLFDAERLSQTGKLRFAAYAKDGTRGMLDITAGRLENMPQRSDRDIQSIKNQQHAQYGYTPAPKTPRRTTFNPDAPQSLD